MKKSTASTLFRVLALIVLSMVMALTATEMGETGSIVANLYAIALAVVTGTILAQLIGRAIDRRRRLLMTVAEELTKLRRIYHLAKNLSTDSEKYRAWFTELHGYLTGYLGFFSDKDFSQYDKSDAAFRKLSYHVYAIPELERTKETALFNDLLDTASSVAAERQHIKELMHSRLPASGWIALAALVALSVFTVTLGTVDQLAARLAAGGLIAAQFIALDLLKQLDLLVVDTRELAGRYAANISRLELSRHE